MGKTMKDNISRKQSKKATTEHSGSGNAVESRWWYLWAVLVAVVSVLVMLTWSITVYSRNSNSSEDSPRGPIPPGTNPKVYAPPGKVAVRHLPSPETPFAKSCAQGGVPVVLRNSIVERWPARRWTLDHLMSNLANPLQGIYENENRWFGPYFDRSKPLIESAVRRNPYRTDLELPSDKFLHRLAHPSENRYHYFTGDIDQLGGWAYEDVQPIRELLLLNPKRSSINAWIGQPHVIAHCHYDGYHNFYAQLIGRKKFTLFRPTNWPGLYPYPFLHPSHAQAQVNASDDGDVGKMGLIGRVEAVEVVLEPGDLLYMPPLWFHEVESLSVSVSVNVWTDSQQTELVERIFSLPLPLGYEHKASHSRHEHAQWDSPHQRRIAAALLIFRLLEKVCAYQSCTEPSKDRFYDPTGAHGSGSGRQKETMNRYAYFVHQLWDTRYRQLMTGGELPREFPNGEHVLCEGGDSEDIQSAILAGKKIDDDVHYGTYLEQVSHLIRGLPADTWQLWVGNYIEYIAANVLSQVNQVGVFLKHFSTCTKILR